MYKLSLSPQRALFATTLPFILCLLLPLPNATAALWTSNPPSGKWKCDAFNNDCVAHTGFNPNIGHWGMDTDPRGNCTNYAAYRAKKNGAGEPGISGNAVQWADSVRRVLGKERVNGTPKVGSIAYWDGVGPFSSCNSDGCFGHVAYVEKIIRGVVNLSDSRYASGSHRWTVSPGTANWPDKFLHIKDAPSSATGASPLGKVDAVTALSKGRIRISGWTFDPDAVKKANAVVIYSGGPIDGKGRKVASAKANKRRADVQRHFAKKHRGITAAHGFDLVASGFKAGKQKIYVYAVDIAGGGKTKLIGSRIVRVNSNTPKPSPEANEAFVTGFPIVENANAMPIVGDFNGDRRADVFLYGAGDAPDAILYGGSRGKFTRVATTVSGNYTPLAGDFDGDGFSDILWYGPGDAPDTSWYGQPGLGAFEKAVATSVSGTYKPFVGDFNGDGKSDVFYYGPAANYDTLHYGKARGAFTHVAVNVDGTYEPIPGDFDGDGRSDVLWYGPGAAPDTSWYANQAMGSFVGAVPTNVIGVYTPLAGDYDGDAHSDIFYYGPGQAYDTLHMGNKRGAFTRLPVEVSDLFTPVAGDFDGDRKSDILWFGLGAAADALWYGR